MNKAVANPTVYDSLEFYPRAAPPSLRAFTLLIHALAFVLVLYLTLQLPWFGLLLPVVLFSLRQSLAKQKTTYPRRITRVVWRGSGNWYWQFCDGRSGQGPHLASSLRLSWLVILYLRNTESGEVTRLVLPRDAMSADQHRHLRVVLARTYK